MRKFKIIFATALISFAFNSCVKKDPVTTIAQVMLAPLSPNAGLVNFSINGEVKATQVSYNTSTGTVRYTFPYYTITPKKGGTVSYNIQTTNQPLASITADLNDEFVYSTFLVDSLARIKALIVEDNLEEPSSDGFIKIRFFNFSPNCPAINVFLVGGSTSPIWSNRAFETQATATANQNFLEMPSGTYSFEVRNATTNALLTTIAAQPYLPERIYTIATRGGFITGATTQTNMSGWVYPNKP